MALSFLIKEIWSGKSVTRAFLNRRLYKETLHGLVIDVGGGKNPDYIAGMHRENATIVNFDVKTGAQVDFEKDSLPAETSTYDTVLFLNVLEHIFNYQHIANEVVRILKPDGQLIGFVPFLMWYHPDHRDYFRYTHEALGIILRNAGAHSIKIEPVAFGPFVAAIQMIVLSLPRLLAVPLFITCYGLDLIFVKIRPQNKGKYALGYFFVIKK